MKDNFVTGYFVGALITLIIVIILFPNPEDFTIKSPKKIEPQIELTTDGKVIDTLYVYKQE